MKAQNENPSYLRIASFVAILLFGGASNYVSAQIIERSVSRPGEYFNAAVVEQEEENSFFQAKGELIVVKFKTGELVKVINELVKDELRDEVIKIRIKGQMNEDDMYAIGRTKPGESTPGKYNFKFCTQIDLSKVEGEIVIPPYAFYKFPMLEEIDLPANTTEIGISAFEQCDNLSSIVLPQTITSIGKKAFSGCIKLKSIKSEASTSPKNGEGAFENGPKKRTLTISGTATGYVPESWGDGVKIKK